MAGNGSVAVTEVVFVPARLLFGKGKHENVSVDGFRVAGEDHLSCDGRTGI